MAFHYKRYDLLTFSSQPLCRTPIVEKPPPQTYEGFAEDLDFLLQYSHDFPAKHPSEFPEPVLLNRLHSAFAMANEAEEGLVQEVYKDGLRAAFDRFSANRTANWLGVEAFWNLAFPGWPPLDLTRFREST